MMNIQNRVIQSLGKNANAFSTMLKGMGKEEYLFKPDEQAWCILEVVCHLTDEEIEDFRARVRIVLESPDSTLPPINPKGWVSERKYCEQDFQASVDKFIAERQKSIDWLVSLKDPRWQNVHNHPKLGTVTASFFLENWLAHDFLHLRQITRLRYQFLKNISQNPLEYAGNW